MKTIQTTIAGFNFLPMIKPVPSVLQYTIYTNNGSNTRLLEEKGSIEDLSAKFGFKVNGDTYDFGSFKGRKCEIQIDHDGFYHFVRML